MVIAGREDLRHGIVVAKNVHAKAYGIQTAMTLWQARRLCRPLVVLPVEHQRYREHSDDIKEYLAQYTLRIRDFGVDEGWYDMTEAIKRYGGRPEALAEKISADIPRLFGITVSIGVSWNMVFAKLGSDMCGHSKVAYITRENEADTRWQKQVFPLPAEDLLYIGHSTKKKLNAYSVYTIGDMAEQPLEFYREKFGKIGLRLYEFARGLDRDLVDYEWKAEPVKSVGNGCTTPRDLKNDHDVLIVASSLVENASRRLREYGLKPHTVSYAARSAATLNGYSRQARLPVPTNRTVPLAKAVYQLFTTSHRWQGALRSFRVCFSDLVDEGAPCQLTLEESAHKAGERDSLQQEIDRLNARYGKTCVRVARSLEDSDLQDMGFQAWNTFAPVGYFGR